MADVSKAIRNYISAYLSLNMPDIQSAVSSREWFLNRIKNTIRGRYKEPVLYSSEPFVYFGSYFKKTKVKAVDEYDVLVVIDSNTGIFSSGGISIGEGQGSADPNSKYASRFYHSSRDGVSPNRILNWLKEIVEEVTESFDGEAPERNGQAITALIKSKNLKIDLVPAGIFKRYSDEKIFYNIPKGDKNGSWIVTSPREDIKLLENVAFNKSNFRNTIRLIKRIKENYNFLISSFAIETAIIQYGQHYQWYNDLSLDVYWILIYLSSVLRNGYIADSYNSENNLIEGVSSLSWYAARIDKVLDTLTECKQWKSQELAQMKITKAFENET
jgi:Mab-21 protein